MTAPEIMPLAAWLTTVKPDQWKHIQRLHYSGEPFNVNSGTPEFMIYPLSSINYVADLHRPSYPNELSRKRFVDARYDEAGYRVRFDLVAAYRALEDDAPYILFAAAKTGAGHFVETIANLMDYVDAYCTGKWCFYNKAFHFQDEGDALMTNAYVYS